jgi:hypothetical protein
MALVVVSAAITVDKLHCYRFCLHAIMSLAFGSCCWMLSWSLLWPLSSKVPGKHSFAEFPNVTIFALAQITKLKSWHVVIEEKG